MKAKGLKQTWSKKELDSGLSYVGNAPVYINVMTDKKNESGFLQPITRLGVCDDLIQIECELDLSNIKNFLNELTNWHDKDGRFLTFPIESLKKISAEYL